MFSGNWDALFLLLLLDVKRSILDFWQGSEYASGKSFTAITQIGYEKHC